MLEIEQKYANADFDALQRRLHALGATGPVVHVEADHYFNAPDRDFARTGEAFRLRRIDQDNYLTFKGPRQPGPVKVRPELEIPLPPGDEGAGRHSELLVLLGYRPVAVVRKRRQTYSLQRDGFQVQVCLDDVEGIGHFAEVEVLAPPADADRASAVLTALAAELGLGQVEQRSYLHLVLTARAAQGQARRAPPAIARSVAELRHALAEARRGRLTIGLVPTMGALHEGHLSLIRAARARNDLVVVSIFVNPTQFGPNEDLALYPRPIDADLAQCAAAGVDLVFHPAPEVMYPPGYRTFVEVTGLQDVLEGSVRPGHFRGVVTVVLKLLNLVGPDRAYFGQKDAQQVRVVAQMVRDLDVPVELVVGPTVREPDGLALSSRNRYLEPHQRDSATALSRALSEAADLARQGERDPAVLVRHLNERLKAVPGAVVDYAVCVDADTFEPATSLDRPALLAVAVRFGATRLIDNLVIGDW
jgi:pantoate--beta-alanine ligase